MNKQQEALRLALEALEVATTPLARDRQEVLRAQAAIREALVDSALERMAENARELGLDYEAAQQEPVAYSYTSRITGAQGFSHHPMPRFIDSESWDIHPLYTSPPASKPWVGLTDEEVDECYYWKGRQWTTDELVRHVEAKLREKNNG